MIYDLILEWDDLLLRIRTTNREPWERLDGARDPIRLRDFRVRAPDVEIDPIPIDLWFAAAEDSRPRVTATDTGLRISGPASYWSEGERLACCVLQLLDRRRLEVGRLCFHGVVLARNGKGVLLTGPSESGKTSSAVALLRQRPGSTAMLSNDHVLADLDPDGTVRMTGNPEVSVAFRSQALWLADRELYRRLFGHHAQPLHYKRLRVAAADLGAAPSPDAPTRLGAIVNVGVGTVVDFEGYQTPTIRATTGLNADLAGRVRCGNLLPLENDGRLGPMLPNLCDDVIDEVIARAIESTVGAGIVYDARGPVGDVAMFVDHLLETA